MPILQYIFTVSICLSLFYIVYRLFSSKEMNFRHLRIYLLGSIALSLALPLSHYRIETGLSTHRKAHEKTLVITSDLHTQVSDQAIESVDPASISISKILADINWYSFALKLYLVVTFIFIARICIQLIVLTIQYHKSFKIRRKDCVLLYNHHFRNTFSFFRWIYIQPLSSSDSDIAHIIAHEKIHISQFHSFDLLLMELLTAVMWFNPLIWMMKNSVQLVHEYLADEGALRTGIDRLRYQAVLINQVTEEKLICLSSSFNNTLIKKRMIMMTTRKINRKTKLTLWTFIPVSISLFFVMAVYNGLFTENVRAGNPENVSILQAMEDQSLTDSNNNLLSLDTIKKHTVVKIVNLKNPQDTIVKETEKIIVTDDSVRHKYVTYDIMDDDGNVMVKTHYYDPADDEGKPVYKKVLMHIDEDVNGDQKTFTIHLDEDGVKETHELQSDSFKIVKVIKKDNDCKEEIVTETRQVKIRSNTGRNASKILYIIDGVESSENDLMNRLDPDQISEMRVIKNVDELKKYTDKDVDGVIIITTKVGKKAKQ